jgi:uncharacterized protein YjbI with pentapeptide repeats
VGDIALHQGRTRWLKIWRLAWPLLVGLLILTLGWLFIFTVPNHLVHADNVPDPAERAKLRHDDRATLLQGLTVILLLLGAGVSLRQLHINREGQVTERFTRAIEQLGSEKIDMRLGAIHALERIAKNSRDDRKAIVEILTAFVRVHSPWPPVLPDQTPPGTPIEDVQSLGARAADVQAAMTVLGRGAISREDGTSRELAYIDLRKANLAHIRLPAAVLRGTHLEGAILTGANLQGAYLFSADLTEANLCEANLKEASLSGACLERAKLISTTLQSADLFCANLNGTYLTRARLNEASLVGATLAGASLGEASLRRANLTGADLRLARHLESSDLSDSRANTSTKLPSAFSAESGESAGIRFL